MGTPKLWIKNTMGQRGKFIRDPTRTEEKKIQKWWENFYIMDGQSTKRYEWHSDQLQQQQKNKEQKQRMQYTNF